MGTRRRAALFLSTVLLLVSPGARAGDGWLKRQIVARRDQRCASYSFRAGVSQAQDHALRAGLIQRPLGPSTEQLQYRSLAPRGLRWIGNLLLERDGKKFGVEAKTVARGSQLSADRYDLFVTGSKKNIAAYVDYVQGHYDRSGKPPRAALPETATLRREREPRQPRRASTASRERALSGKPVGHRDSPRFAVISDGNLPHREENQDHFGQAVNKRGATLLLVADGAGGHSGGRLAARLGVQAITRSFRTTSGKRPYDKVLRRMLWRANRVLNRSRATGQQVGYSTVTGAVVTEKGDLYVANLGDSPAYLFSSRQGRTAQLSRNQNGAADNVITDYLGKELGKAENQVQMAARARLAAGDRVLLCSDGLSKYVPFQTISQLLGQKDRDVNDLARVLVETAKRNGSDDNITVHIYEHH